MRIGLDLDGPCYDWSGTVRYLVRAHWGIDVGLPVTWDHVQDTVPAEVWTWLWTDGIELGLFRYGHHVRGSVDGIRALAKLGEVEVVTHRPPSALRDTLLWASTLPDLSGFHFLSRSEPKSLVGCDVYVDDAPHVADEVVAAGKDVILFDEPYNQDVAGPMIWRAMNWDEVVAQVELVLDIRQVEAM